MKELINQNNRPLTVFLLGAGIILYVLFFSIYQIQRYKAYETALDTTSMEQPIWNTLQGRFMRATYYPVTGSDVIDFMDRVTVNKWGDHVQPILLVLLLPYAFLQRSETLMVVLSICVALGAIPLYRIVLRRFGSPWLALIFAFGYLILPAIQTNTAWDTHTTNFLPPLILAAIDAAENRQRAWWWFWVILAMSLREDMPLMVAWAMVWLVPKNFRRDSLLMLGIGACLSILFFGVIIPKLGGGGGTPYYVRFFPSDMLFTTEGIKQLLLSRWFWINSLYKFMYYNTRLGLPFLYTYWFYLPSLVAMMPQVILNTAAWWWPILMPETYHYSALVIPIAFIGSVRGFYFLEIRLRKLKPQINWRGLIGTALGASFLASQIMTGYTPLSINFSWPQSPRQVNTAADILALVPPNASISAENGLASHLGQRETLRFFPDIRDVDYILLDIWYGQYRYYLPEAETNLIIREILKDPGWSTVKAVDGMILLNKGNGPPQGIEDAFYPDSDESQNKYLIQFGSEENSLQLQDIQLFSNQKESGLLLCTDWNRTGSGNLFPQIQIKTKDLDITKPLIGADIYPGLFSPPGTYRDCTRLMLTVSQSAEIFLWVEDTAGTRLPVQLTNGMRDVKTDIGLIQIEQDSILINLKP